MTTSTATIEAPVKSTYSAPKEDPIISTHYVANKGTTEYSALCLVARSVATKPGRYSICTVQVTDKFIASTDRRRLHIVYSTNAKTLKVHPGQYEVLSKDAKKVAIAKVEDHGNFPPVEEVLETPLKGDFYPVSKPSTGGTDSIAKMLSKDYHWTLCQSVWDVLGVYVNPYFVSDITANDVSVCLEVSQVSAMAPNKPIVFSFSHATKPSETVKAYAVIMPLDYKPSDLINKD